MVHLPNVFKVFQFFGVYQPYRSTQSVIRKWHYHSYVFALFAASFAFYRGLQCITNDELNETKKSSLVYKFLLRSEPMFLFIHISVIFCTSLNNTKASNYGSQIIRVSTTLKSSKNYNHGSENKIIYYTYVTLLLLLISIVKLHYLNAEFVPSVTFLDLIDLLESYLSEVIIAIQLLQFCVYFKVVINAFSYIEYLIHELNTDTNNGPKSYEMLVGVNKLSRLITKFGHAYWPSIVLQQLNCLLYCILGYKAFYDFFCQKYVSPLHSLIFNLWIVYFIPLQFYLMHLGDVIQTKVRNL